MWVIPVTILIVATSFIALLLAGRTRPPVPKAAWDLDILSTAYAALVSTLAALSIASTIFLANLTLARELEAIPDVMAMFLIGFMIEVGAAIMFATTRSWVPEPSETEGHVTSHRLMYILSNATFYLGLTITWIGLRPLLVTLNMPTLATVFLWLLAFVTLSGAARLGSWLHSLLGVRLLACVAIPVVGLAAPAIYRFAIAAFAPSFWPQRFPTLAMGLVAFGIGGISYGFETAMIALRGNTRLHSVIERVGSRALTAYVQAVAIAVGLVLVSTA